MLRESEVFVYYFDVRVLLCCRWEFFVVVLLGMNVFLKCWAIELVSERCIVSLLDRVVEVKPTYRNQMHYNYKSDEKIMKTLIHKNILPTDFNKKIKLIIYYNKFKTSNLVISNNSSPSIGVLQKTNVIYKFKCPLGDCISDNNNIYVGLTSTTLSRRLTMHLSDTSSIAQHFKKTFMPNNTTTKNSHRQHNNTRTSK